MPLPIIPLPIPLPLPFPGVPTLPNNPFATFAQITNNINIIANDAQIVANMFQPPQWGIFDGADPIINGAVISVEFNNDFRVATAPQEEGAFLSYNKVADPYSGRITYAKSGTASERNAFLTEIKEAQKQLTPLFQLIMPDAIYQNINVVKYSISRQAGKGAYMLVIEVFFQEIRQAGTPTFTKTSNPTATATESSGTVQPETPSAKDTAPITTPQSRSNPFGNTTSDAAQPIVPTEVGPAPAASLPLQPSYTSGVGTGPNGHDVGFGVA